MSNCSPRHLLRASTSTWQSSRTRTAPTTINRALTPSRQTHTQFPDRISPPSSTSQTRKSKPSRRNAHALASHSRYDGRAPPPPPPVPNPSRGTLDQEGTSLAREDEIDNEAFPVWETRDSAVNGELERYEGYSGVGETVYADEEDGDVEMDWEDYKPVARATVEKRTETAVIDNKEKFKAKENGIRYEAPERRSRISSQELRPTRPSEPLFTSRVQRDPTARLRLRPVERLPSNTVSPYVALSPPTSPCSVHPSPQPHELPLVSRSDWRLSSPLRRYLRSSPPSLYSRLENDTKSQGHNRFVGVGVEPGRTTKSYKSKDAESSEPWGWKAKVKESEKGSWPAADLYRKRLDRLISLSRKSDEDNYRLALSRQGTPAEREIAGKTLCRAIGTWLTDSSRAEAIQELKKNRDASATNTGNSGNGVKAIASFQAEDGRELTEDLWEFSPANTIVRITRAPQEQEIDLNGPQRPPTSSSDPNDWFVQGTVLEARESQLVVSFDESDLWPIEEGDVYQIDIGLDESSYILQEQAINNLYFDPSHQRQRNATHVKEAQEALLQGSNTILREWALQGTDLRELIVPKVEAPPEEPRERVWEQDVLEEEDSTFDNSPATELAHLPSSDALLSPDLFLNPRKTSSKALHPSDLLTQNQLINSWVKRYMRDDPMILPGDPDLGLNPSQIKAVAMAIGEKLSLIQGPPGTGKSQTIVSLISLLKLHFRIPQPILLAAPTHVSTDHLLSLLVRRGLNPLRCGKPSKVSPEIEKWTIEKRQEQHPLWNRLEETRLEGESLRDEVKRSKEVTASILNPKERALAEARDADLENKYRKMWRKYIMLEQKLYSSLLATADVFCATALGSGASKVLSLVDFPIVFIDEAAMCTEPVTLIPLMKGAQQVTLIGDHKQLPAVVSSQEAKKERLQISLFERLLKSQNINSVLLDIQYRMRPAISAFPNLSFYRSALKDASSVQTRPPPPRSRFFIPSISLNSTTSTSAKDDDTSELLPVAFVSHSGPESVSNRSSVNRTEVELILEIVGDLLERNPALDPRDIGIISPYYAQTQLLVNTFESGWAAKRLSKVIGRSRASELQAVEINTVDGFQGREKKVIILSTVRSNREGRIGFLTDKRRLNVALTRAKDALFVIGNKETLRQAAGNDWMEVDPDSDAGIWRRFLIWCEQRGLVRDWKQGE
ncbi:hypothetical protein JCM5350_003073 [Sporobolomyces pararoseus]